jgi:hypothetical protein
VEALEGRGIALLVDVRNGPCASDLDPASRYGPKPWHLQANGRGIVGLLGEAGIAYEWVVELGNPQRQDPAMAVFRAHLADPAGAWPVHRGLERLAARVREADDGGVAILCACAVAESCHRTPVARALADLYFGGGLEFRDLKTGQPVGGQGHFFLE